MMTDRPNVQAHLFSKILKTNNKMLRMRSSRNVSCPMQRFKLLAIFLFHGLFWFRSGTVVCTKTKTQYHQARIKAILVSPYDFRTERQLAIYGVQAMPSQLNI